MICSAAIDLQDLQAAKPCLSEWQRPKHCWAIAAWQIVLHEACMCDEWSESAAEPMEKIRMTLGYLYMQAASGLEVPGSDKFLYRLPCSQR